MITRNYSKMLNVLARLNSGHMRYRLACLATGTTNVTYKAVATLGEHHVGVVGPVGLQVHGRQLPHGENHG